MSPAPPGLEDAPVRPGGARFDLALGEFVLPYSDAGAAADPDAAALDFFRSAFARARHSLNGTLAASPKMSHPDRADARGSATGMGDTGLEPVTSALSRRRSCR